MNLKLLKRQIPALWTTSDTFMTSNGMKTCRARGMSSFHYGFRGQFKSFAARNLRADDCHGLWCAIPIGTGNISTLATFSIKLWASDNRHLAAHDSEAKCL